jgi:superfamily II DNA or RNA helicase
MKGTETNVGEYVAEKIGDVKETPIILHRSGHLPFYFIKGTLRRSVITALESELSFDVKGKEYMEAYLVGDWNGREVLLYATKKTGMRYFPIGLLDQVTGILDDFGVQYTVEDSPDLKEPMQIDVGWISKKKLFPDQEDAVAVALQEGMGTICMPTGTGKTMVALALIATLKMKTLVVVHRKELLMQWKKSIKEELGYDAGIVGGGREKWKDITVCMVQSLYKRKEIPIKFDILFGDESHTIPAKTAYKACMKINATFRWGLSATPHRFDGADLKMFASFGKIIYLSRPEGAITKGRIVRPEFRFIETVHPRNIYRGMKYHDAYVLGITANDDRNRKIVEQANKLLAEGHTVYVHVEEVAHGKWLAGHIPGAEFVCGEDNNTDRARIIGDFSSGKLKVCVSTLLGTGVDIPRISGLIMAGGRKTEIGCIQKIGRALRTLPGKDKAVIVDFRDKGTYLQEHFQERYGAYKRFYGKYCPDL